jgi:hypothetical protein
LGTLKARALGYAGRLIDKEVLGTI